jgi:hypothetical protein
MKKYIMTCGMCNNFKYVSNGTGSCEHISIMLSNSDDLPEISKIKCNKCSQYYIFTHDKFTPGLMIIQTCPNLCSTFVIFVSESDTINRRRIMLNLTATGKFSTLSKVCKFIKCKICDGTGGITCKKCNGFNNIIFDNTELYTWDGALNAFSQTTGSDKLMVNQRIVNCTCDNGYRIRCNFCDGEKAFEGYELCKNHVTSISECPQLWRSVSYAKIDDPFRAANGVPITE